MLILNQEIYCMAEVEVEENAAEDLSIPASEIVAALRTRPSLLLRRAGNRAWINRSSSLPHSATAGRERRLHLHRSRSEESVTPYALYGDVQVEIPPSNQGRRRITVKLKERIRQDQSVNWRTHICEIYLFLSRIERQAAAVNNSVWENFAHVVRIFIDIRIEGLETAHVRHIFQWNVERAILAVANWLVWHLAPQKFISK